MMTGKECTHLINSVTHKTNVTKLKPTYNRTLTEAKTCMENVAFQTDDIINLINMWKWKNYYNHLFAILRQSVHPRKAIF